jgi:hypothetical protein
MTVQRPAPARLSERACLAGSDHRGLAGAGHLLPPSIWPPCQAIAAIVALRRRCAARGSPRSPPSPIGAGGGWSAAARRYDDALPVAGLSTPRTVAAIAGLRCANRGWWCRQVGGGGRRSAVEAAGTGYRCGSAGTIRAKIILFCLSTISRRRPRIYRWGGRRRAVETPGLAVYLFAWRRCNGAFWPLRSNRCQGEEIQRQAA